MDARDRMMSNRRFSRRKFVGLGIAGIGLGLLPGCGSLSAAQQAPTSAARKNEVVLYRGHEISLGVRNGPKARKDPPELSIDGKPIVTVDSNGAFRAANFMFSPAKTRVELAKSIVDYEIALSRS